MIPKLNDTPKYEMVIPSMDKSVRFRPYLVKEEKILLMAFESDNQTEALKAIGETVLSCIDEEIKIEDLKLYDIEYMFTKLRAKSVGENSEVTVACDKCEHKNDIKINLDTVKVNQKEDISSTIQLTDTISVEMGYPNFSKMISNKKIVTSDQNVESMIEVIADCIVNINTEEEKIQVKDEPREKIIEFIDSMTNDQFILLKNYMDSMPRVEIEHKYVCNGCKNDNTIKIRNVADFF